MPDNTFKDHSGNIYKNLNSFIDINDKVEHDVEDLVTATESAMNRIEYKIEHKPLKIMGIEMNYELIFEIVLVVGSVIVAFMQ